MQTVLAAALEEAPDIRLDADWSTPIVVSGLVGRDCERVARNRGGDVYVAPLCHLSSDLLAWLSYREEWAGESTSRKRRFAFRTSSISIYFGKRYDAYKPQMFRAEWAGWARWRGGQYSFQGGDAGHPHWQIDAVESLQGDDSDERAAELSVILAEEEQGEKIGEFGSGSTYASVKTAVAAQGFSRLHLPSAAAWWQSAPDDSHAHSPKNTTEVRNWVQRSLGNIRYELTRLRSA